MAELNLVLVPPDAAAAKRAQDKWNAVAKPIASLGLLEDAVIKIAALTGSEQIDISKRCVAVLCADNGVVAQGVSQSGPEVTSVVANNIAQNISSVCMMCAPIHTDCIPFDFGMARPASDSRIRDKHIARGTADISCGPAMTREQALQAIQAGIDVAAELKSEGYSLIAMGEMGIGNTTTSTAMACVFTGKTPEEITGRGAGLSNAGLARKSAAIAQALAVNAPDAQDAIDVLAKVGGFDIAGLCGVCLGGALHRVPIIVDGLISVVAAYCATRIQPACTQALLASHLSSEPATTLLLERMELEPVIFAGMHLGEGTGAACLIPLLDMALSLYNGTSFNDCGLEAYKVNPQ